MHKQKIAVAMSGGVDSSVVAKILRDEGHELVGLFLKLWSDSFCDDKVCTAQKENRCCNYEALEDARKVAAKLNIPFYVIDAKREFKKEIVDYFLEEYKNLRTPNPCIFCNEKIKFNLLLKKALAIGCDFLATGHYARIRNAGISNFKFPPRRAEGETGLISKQISNNQITNFKLLKGKDDSKDQSYMLYRLNQNQLSKVLFPIGEMKKKEVRALAVKWDLPVKEKPESQEICFFSDRDYRQFLRRHLPLKYFKSGDIVDDLGNVIGKHQGLLNYTIGQRKGIEQLKVKSQKLKVDGKIKNVISIPQSAGAAGEKSHEKQPLYVTGFDAKKNQLIVGDDRDCFKSEMIVGDLNFIYDCHPELPPRRAVGETGVSGSQIKVKIRYRHSEVECGIVNHSALVEGPKKLTIKFKKPQRAITPGQSAVFYLWEEVLGGGIIEK